MDAGGMKGFSEEALWNKKPQAMRRKLAKDVPTMGHYASKGKLHQAVGNYAVTNLGTNKNSLGDGMSIGDNIPASKTMSRTVPVEYQSERQLDLYGDCCQRRWTKIEQRN